MDAKLDYTKFDPEVAEQELGKIKEILEDLDENYTKITDDTNFIKDYWDTKTSDNVFNNISELEKKIVTIKENFASDVVFLDNAVKQSYINRDKESTDAANQQLHD